MYSVYFVLVPPAF